MRRAAGRRMCAAPGPGGIPGCRGTRLSPSATAQDSSRTEPVARSDRGEEMLDVEQRSGVTVLRLRHGKVNALDVDLLRAITVAMREAPPDAAVVITGAGTAFSAGVDLKRIVDGGHSYVREFLPALSAAFMAVFDHPGPVVAAINGHAIAGGCVLAAACDLRLMSRGTIGLAELSVGVPFPPAAVEILRYAIGRPPPGWCSRPRCWIRPRRVRPGWSMTSRTRTACWTPRLAARSRWHGPPPGCFRSASASCSSRPGTGSRRAAMRTRRSWRCGPPIAPGTRSPRISRRSGSGLVRPAPAPSPPPPGRQG